MKAIILIIFLMLPVKAIAPTDNKIYIIQRGIDPIEVLWGIMCEVESSGNPWEFIIDSNGKYSVGIAMIQQSRVNDYNKLTGKDYALEDCFDPAVSKEIWYYYADAIGYDPERISREWNGGPKGMQKKSTLMYWKLIKARL